MALVTTDTGAHSLIGQHQISTPVATQDIPTGSATFNAGNYTHGKHRQVWPESHQVLAKVDGLTVRISHCVQPTWRQFIGINIVKATCQADHYATDQRCTWHCLDPIEQFGRVSVVNWRAVFVAAAAIAVDDAIVGLTAVAVIIIIIITVVTVTVTIINIIIVIIASPLRISYIIFVKVIQDWCHKKDKLKFNAN